MGGRLRIDLCSMHCGDDVAILLQELWWWRKSAIGSIWRDALSGFKIKLVAMPCHAMGIERMKFWRLFLVLLMAGTTQYGSRQECRGPAVTLRRKRSNSSVFLFQRSARALAGDLPNAALRIQICELT